MSKLTIRWVAAAAASVVVLGGLGCARQQVQSSDTAMSRSTTAATPASTTYPSRTTDPVASGTMPNSTMGTAPNNTYGSTPSTAPTMSPSTTTAGGMGSPSGVSMTTTNPNASTSGMTTSSSELPARADRN